MPHPSLGPNPSHCPLWGTGESPPKPRCSELDGTSGTCRPRRPSFKEGTGPRRRKPAPLGPACPVHCSCTTVLCSRRTRPGLHTYQAPEIPPQGSLLTWKVKKARPDSGSRRGNQRASGLPLAPEELAPRTPGEGGFISSSSHDVRVTFN